MHGAKTLREFTSTVATSSRGLLSLVHSETREACKQLVEVPR